MSGLFQRALELQNGTQPEDEFALDQQSGISEEDQKEILAEIEKVAEESRISVSPETLAIKAARRGYLFPLLVNIAAVVLLAAGGFALYTLFQRGETVLMEEGGAIASAEGKLIEELKKESEAKLLEKNKQISGIQSRLEDIDKQRQDLQSNMDAKIQAREAELRSTLEAELAAEREKLRQQGISEADITRRLEELEAQKSSVFQQELDTFKAQAEEERSRAEENLKNLQEEYQQNLAQANADRERVLAESKQREADLRSQLDARTKELEEETLQAREELGKLAAQQEKQELAASQLNGFYSRVKSDIQQGNFDKALADLDSIKEYLDDPSVATLPNMLQRREIELFVVDSISNLVQEEMQQTEVDTSSLIASADLVTDMKNRVIRGDELFRQGQIEAAELEYEKALAMIPEVSKAHNYYLDKQAEAETIRRTTLRDYLGRAEAAYQRGDYSATLDNYTKALAYLPEDAATVEKTVSQVRRSGYQLGLAQLRRQDSTSAAVPLAEAENLYNQEDYNGAILGYIDLIAGYPNSSQVQAAVEGIASSVEALEAAAKAQGETVGAETAGTVSSEELAALQGELDALNKTLTEKNSEINDLQARLDAKSGDTSALEQSIEDKNQEIADLEARIEELQGDTGEVQRNLEERAGELEQELESKVALIDTLQSEKQALEQEITSLNSQIEQMEAEQAAVLENLDDALGQKISRLEGVEKRYNKLVDSYGEYTTREDELLGSGGEDALIQSKLYLNTFLATSEESFPGLWDRIKRYDDAFEKAGRASAAADVSDILFELSLRERADSRELYLQSEKARYKDVPEMVDLIEDLGYLITD